MQIQQPIRIDVDADRLRPPAAPGRRGHVFAVRFLDGLADGDVVADDPDRAGPGRKQRRI